MKTEIWNTVKKNFWLLLCYLLLGILIGQRCNAQHTISFTLSGSDLAMGGRYDYQFNKYGVYTGIGMGHYNTIQTGITEHQKASVGMVRYYRNNPAYGLTTYFSGGLNGHIYSQEEEGFQHVTDRGLWPVSFELGCGGIIAEHYSFGFTYDPLKHDGMFNVGIRFGLKKDKTCFRTLKLR